MQFQNEVSVLSPVAICEEPARSMHEPVQTIMPSACLALRSASRAVTQLYDLVLAPTGLKATQFSILQAIYTAGEIAQCEFARSNSLSVATLSRRFGSLRKKEYIQIRKGERHGERIYSLTPKGRQAFHDALPYWERAQQRLRTAMGEGDWRLMLDLTDRIRSAALKAEQLRTENQLRSMAGRNGNGNGNGAADSHPD